MGLQQKHNQGAEVPPPSCLLNHHGHSHACAGVQKVPLWQL